MLSLKPVKVKLKASQVLIVLSDFVGFYSFLA
jgi:hypothetical protein